MLTLSFYSVLLTSVWRCSNVVIGKTVFRSGHLRLLIVSSWERQLCIDLLLIYHCHVRTTPDEDSSFRGKRLATNPVQGYVISTTLRVRWVLTFAFTGMAGNQVLEWVDLDTEIKTAGLKDVRDKCDLPHISLADRLG